MHGDNLGHEPISSKANKNNDVKPLNSQQPKNWLLAAARKTLSAFRSLYAMQLPEAAQ
jgi:hypothetical protein